MIGAPRLLICVLYAFLSLLDQPVSSFNPLKFPFVRLNLIANEIKRKVMMMLIDD